MDWLKRWNCEWIIEPFPSVAVYFSDGCHTESEVIAQKNDLLMVVLVPKHVGVLGRRAIFDHLVCGVVLLPGDERGPAGKALDDASKPCAGNKLHDLTEKSFWTGMESTHQ